MLTKRMKLDDTLTRHIPIANAASVTDVFGIEVELEGKNIMSPEERVKILWAQHNDGSLRKIVPGSQAVEYVSRSPYNLKNTEKAIQLLFGYLTGPGVEVFDSYRTSIHVHVNYSQESFRTIYNSMVLSVILDELLVSQNGEHRVGNNFCFRAKDAMGQIVELVNSISQGSDFFGIQQNNRYSSINFASLLKFGSIEYRSLECTLHEGRLMHWIGTLQQIKERARTFQNPTAIIQQFSMMDSTEFLKNSLGPYAIKYLKVAGFEEMLRDGMRIAQDLAFCSAWNEGALTE